MEVLTNVEDWSRYDGRVKWAILVTALLFSVLTYFFTHFVVRFGVEKEQLLRNDTFAHGAAEWQEEGSEVVDFGNNQVKIANSPGASHAVSQNIVVDVPAFYRFGYTLQVNEVVPDSPEEWALASVAVIYYDADGKRSGSRMLSSLSGTEPPRRFSEELLLRESVASVDFSVRLYRAGGELILSDPVVSQLRELTVYKALMISVIVLWTMLSAFIVYLLMRFFRAGQVLTLAAMASIALIGVMMPETTMTELTHKLAGEVPGPSLVHLRSILSVLYADNKFSAAGTEVSKLGHFTIFMCFGVFAGLYWRRCGIYFAFAAIFVFAVVTEALQTLVYGRTTNYIDLILDTAGGLLGLVFGIVLVELIGLFRKVSRTE